jgi:hypothetical protein
MSRSEAAYDSGTEQHDGVISEASAIAPRLLLLFLMMAVWAIVDLIVWVSSGSDDACNTYIRAIALTHAIMLLASALLLICQQQLYPSGYQQLQARIAVGILLFLQGCYSMVAWMATSDSGCSRLTLGYNLFLILSFVMVTFGASIRAMYRCRQQQQNVQ